MPARSATSKPAVKKRATIVEVADLAGVSQSAVSKVIRDAYGVSPAMRERVQSAMEQLGYRPRLGARSLRGKSHLIGVEIPQLTNEFFSQIIFGIQEGLANTKFQLVVAPPLREQECRDSLYSLVDHQVDGIIAIAPDVPPNELERIHAFAPIVLIGRHDLNVKYDVVNGDDAAGAKAIMNHLADLGHERIVHLTVEPNFDRPDARQPHSIRREVYNQMMVERNLTPQVAICGPEEKQAYETTIVALSQSPRPTAIFAGNDTLAIGALRALADLELTVSDVSVAGYDDIDIASHPLISLTTVTQFGHQMGRKAVELLFERLDEERTSPNSLQITPAIRKRNSTTAVSPK